jgi:hypothetical protein
MTTEEITSKYNDSGNNELLGINNDYNNKEIQFKLQQKIEDYILLTQTRVSNNKTATICAIVRLPLLDKLLQNPQSTLLIKLCRTYHLLYKEH